MFESVLFIDKASDQKGVSTAFQKCNFYPEFSEILGKTLMLSLIEYAKDLQNNALWDTFQDALFIAWLSFNPQI